ncbi:CU044_5270 family protein [Actinomadura miaoliensis]|uniref:CU044_5270 family protein n=1 Tax=Actinomadura miaoliensis TaxID=430685 RepID=A0ABP7X6N2_9ACTN
MNATPIQHGPDDREELARLLPGPAERDLPSDRHRQLQEFVMGQIEQDLKDRREPRRAPWRRPALLAAALTAVAATATAVVVASGGSPEPPRQSPPAAASPSGRQILLVAATTAERAPEGTGKYWHVKVVEGGGDGLWWETWTRSDGRTWSRGTKTRSDVTVFTHPSPFRFGGENVSFEQLRTLPTEPEALRAWLTRNVESSDVRTGAGRPDAAMREQIVFDGLVSLVSQLPAPPKVRAAAFRAIAASPKVKSLGPVKGGQGLLITTDHGQARLVVDPTTSRVRNTNHFVTADGARVTSEDGVTIVAEWTDTPPA